MRHAIGACGLAVAVLAATTGLGAQIPTDRTYLEFATPIRIPGASLAPGMYLFVIGRPIGGQFIIDIYSADGARLVATTLAVESPLAKPAAVTTLDYAAGAAPALRAWFPAASLAGVEFVYSRADATALFSATGLPVPYAPFRPATRDLVGAFPVSRATPVPRISVAGAGIVAPLPVATAGRTAVIEAVDETLGPHLHLTTARRVLAERATVLSRRDRLGLDNLGQDVSALQAAFRRGKHTDASERLQRVMQKVDALIAGAPARDTVLALERVRAHAAAFAKFLRPPSRR